MDTLGKHLLVEYTGCDSARLNDVEQIQWLMESAAKAAGTRIVQSVFHSFQPQGVSGVVVIEESHLSIHTWPEHGYASVDFYTCGKGDPRAAYQIILDGLKASSSEIILVDRGLLSNTNLMKMQFHKME